MRLSCDTFSPCPPSCTHHQSRQAPTRQVSPPAARACDYCGGLAGLPTRVSSAMAASWASSCCRRGRASSSGSMSSSRSASFFSLRLVAHPPSSRPSDTITSSDRSTSTCKHQVCVNNSPQQPWSVQCPPAGLGVAGGGGSGRAGARPPGWPSRLGRTGTCHMGRRSVHHHRRSLAPARPGSGPPPAGPAAAARSPEMAVPHA